jgi:hypothetical protein
MAAAAWADVAPWRLGSESDLVFVEHSPGSGLPPARLEFEVDDAGAAVALVFSGPLDGRWVRAGDLWDGWESSGSDCREGGK